MAYAWQISIDIQQWSIVSIESIALGSFRTNEDRIPVDLATRKMIFKLA